MKGLNLMDIILASESPRRHELMKLTGAEFTVHPAHIDESAICSESRQSPKDTALWLAGIKAQAVSRRYPKAAVIGCDTVVEVDGKILGKPKSKKEAGEMLHMLSGKEHWVHTGVYIIRPAFERAKEEIEAESINYAESTKVYFSALPLKDIAAYIETDEPYDKAGGYAVQGWAAKYIHRIEGCYYNVMGLPVASVMQSLKKLGLID